MHILFVEDNPDLVEDLYDFFEARGHVVDAAYDGSSGLEFIRQNSYDVVVLDTYRNSIMPKGISKNALFPR